MHHLHDVLGGEAGVLDVRHLVTAAVLHLFVGDEAVALGVVVELGAGIGVGHGDLDGLAVQDLGEVDCVADGLFGLTRQAEDEVGVDDEAEVVAVLDEVARTFDRGTLLDVLEDLRIAGLEADDKQTAASFLHGLEGVVVGGDARRAAPGDADGLELFAEFDGANLLDVEGIVVEEELLDVGEVLLCPCHFGGNVVGGTLAPGMAAESLGPQAERALRRATARGVERDVRVQKERHVVARDVHVARVDLGSPGHRVEVFDLRAIRIVLDDAVGVIVSVFVSFFIADAEDLVQGLAVGKLYDGEVELAAADKVEDFAFIQGAVRVRGDRGANKTNLDGGIRLLDGAC